MHCPQCGNENAADAKFCAFCGARLDVVIPAAAQRPLTVPAPPEERGDLAALVQFTERREATMPPAFAPAAQMSRETPQEKTQTETAHTEDWQGELFEEFGERTPVASSPMASPASAPAPSPAPVQPAQVQLAQPQGQPAPAQSAQGQSQPGMPAYPGMPATGGQTPATAVPSMTNPAVSDAAAPGVPNPAAPGTAAPGVPPAPAPAPDDPAKRRRNRLITIIIAAIVAVALVITVAVVAVRHVQAQQEQQAAAAASRQANARAKAEAKRREQADAQAEKNEKKEQKTQTRTLDTKQLDRIVDSYSTTDVGVAVMAQDNVRAYSSRAAGNQFIAAGLYLPVYLASPRTPTPSDSAGEMMRTMNNDAANSVIDSEGGLDGLNRWLADHHYSGTHFARKFGDVAASDSGQENYSTPDDAARMLMAVADDGGDQLMSANMAAEGVAIPQDVALYAHRGAGIQDAYNYFLVMSSGNQKVGVAVMTRGLGRERAAQLTSDVLANIAQQLFWED